MKVTKADLTNARKKVCLILFLKFIRADPPEDLYL
jgi:hypothetical protein